jgi:hypothetical protein
MILEVFHVNIACIAKSKSVFHLLALLSHDIAHILNEHTHEFAEYSERKDNASTPPTTSFLAHLPLVNLPQKINEYENKNA